MIILAPILAASIMLGLVMLIRGIVPVKPELRSELDYFASSATDVVTAEEVSFSTRAEGWLMTSHSDSKEQFLADLAVSGRSRSKHLSEVAKSMSGAALILYVSFFLFGRRSPLFLVVALLVGVPLGYWMAEKDLASKARKRRSEFDETLTAVLSLMAVSMAGGSGLNTAIDNTLRLGDGWAVVAIRRAVDEAKFRNETPWAALGRLGNELGISNLIELSATLSLVGTSGARVAETLLVRSATARSQLLSEKKSLAVAKSSAMGMPVGLMMFAWLVFLAFSPVMTLLSS